VRVPDYISPIVAYRIWRWHATGLLSLNGEPWVPGRPLAAHCKACGREAVGGRVVRVAHDSPHFGCSCGVYASKSLDHLRSSRLFDLGVSGEVFLWGLTVEHERGFRSQFAYPKSLHLPPDSLPVTLAEIEFRLRSLVQYRCDISIAHDGGNIPLWRKESGLEAAGLDFLLGRSKEWYARRRQERTLTPGDRVAIIGRSIAVVEQVDATQVHAVLWNKGRLRIDRKDILWDEQNTRWEASPHACGESNGKAA